MRISYTLLNLLYISFFYKVKEIPQSSIFIRTWLIPKSFEKNCIRDDYFRDLIKDLEKREIVVVGFMPNGFNLLKRLKKIDLPNNYILTPGLLSFKEVFQVVFDYIFNGRLILKRSYNFKNTNITKLINESLTRDYLELRSFSAFLELYIAKNLKKFEPKVLMYVFENQAWERANLKVFSKTNTKTIGYQSSGFSPRFLNFFPSKLDKEIQFFPNLILTAGEVFTEKLKTLGNYPVPITTFGAMRFNYQLDNNEQYLIRGQSSKVFKRVLYAFPVLLYQYDKIIKDLIEVFKNSEIEIHLKFHPLFMIDNFHNSFGKLPSNFKFINSVKMDQLAEVYDVVIFNDNSFGIESLIQGVPSYEYDLEESVDDTRLFNFHIYESKLKKTDLDILKSNLMSNKKEYLEPKLVSEYIKNVYTPYISGKTSLTQIIEQ